MNIHHLELFYYVAKHGGIMEAVRRIPYGIQQPAVSGQIIQLEDNLGVKLFQRRPFSLSPEGHQLFDSIRPFFDNIEGICDQIRDGTSELIRLGAPTLALDRYFPDIIRSLRESLPGVKLALREGHHHHIQQMLENGHIDLAITPIEGSLPQGFETVSLMKIDVCLLVSKNSQIQSADHFWEQDRIAEPLISLPSTELVTKRFQSFLEGNSLSWPSLIELSSLDLIESYVASGIGVGLGVQNLSAEPSRDICRLPLEGIETITVGALWRKNLSRAGRHILDLCQEKASDLRKLQTN
jgi:DNA-binding transcriptional LysR family regulator